MSDEEIKVEEKECNCPVCRVLKSDCAKKFLAMTLASFIGCSLALLVFAPKPPHRDRCPQPPMEYRMDRPYPPAMHKFQYHHEFSEHRPFDVQRCPKNEFRGDRPLNPEFAKKKGGCGKIPLRNGLPVQPEQPKVEE